jgi:hypothetical protein
MARTPYPYLHGGNTDYTNAYSESPWANWEKNGRWYPPSSVGATFDSKGYPQTNPNSGETLAYVIQEGNTGYLPAGNYWIKTDPGIVLTSYFGGGMTVSQSGLSAPQIAEGLWRMTVSYGGGGPFNYALGVNLGGGANAGTYPMTHIRIRTDADGSVPASVYNDNVVWRQGFLDVYENFGCVRFMNWMRTNDPYIEWASPDPTTVSQCAVPTSWATRPTLDTLSWGGHPNDGDPNRGVPVEVMVDLCNTLQIDGWFTLHYLATSGYMTSFVTYLRDNLDANLKAHIEHSNEVWNTIFGQTSLAYIDGEENRIEGVAGYETATTDSARWNNAMRAASDRAKVLAEIVNTVYAGITSRKRNVLAFFGVNVFNGQFKGEWGNLQDLCDVFSPAPYFYVDGHGLVPPATLGDGTPGSAAWFAALKPLCSADIANRHELMEQCDAYAQANDMAFACYEGGQHLLSGGSTPIHNALMTFNASQDMGDLYQEYIDGMRAIPGMMMAWYKPVGPWGTAGYWGHKQTLTGGDTPKSIAVINDTLLDNSAESYTFTFVATDAGGNTTEQVVVIGVE